MPWPRHFCTFTDGGKERGRGRPEGSRRDGATIGSMSASAASGVRAADEQVGSRKGTNQQRKVELMIEGRRTSRAEKGSPASESGERGGGPVSSEQAGLSDLRYGRVRAEKRELGGRMEKQRGTGHFYTSGKLFRWQRRYPPARAGRSGWSRGSLKRMA